MISGIYIIQNLINHKVYIGSAIDLLRRYRDHKFCLKSNNHGNQYLQNAWNKYGKENFCFWAVEVIKEKNVLLEREQFYLDMFRVYPFGLYNIRLIAESNLGIKFSDESKRKISESKRGRKGRKLSEVERQKLSILMKGKRLRLGLKNSDEAKRKVSEA